MAKKGQIWLLCLMCCGAAHAAEFLFDAGADLRIREELMQNVPGLPGGGLMLRDPHGPFRNHMRYRARVGGDVRLLTETYGNWRLSTRLVDEVWWCPEPKNEKQTWPGEVALDNLFLEGTDLFDGFMDVSIGRQDLWNYCGLNHIFQDGTPGDGSRTTFSDMIKLAFKFTKDERLDLFLLRNGDRNELRFGTDRSRRNLAGIDPSADPEADDWGAGAIWSGRAPAWLPYQIFIIDKHTQAYHVGDTKYPWTNRGLLGFKVVPEITREWSVPLEAMGQLGRDGDNELLYGWSTYAAVQWKSARTGWKPFSSLGYHIMSGDEDTAETRGRHGWDPMWARSPNDSEAFAYGTHYGTGYWSNFQYIKLTGGLDLGKRHSLRAYTGPVFAQAQDGLGGGDGMYKGFLSALRYDFPLWLAARDKGERFEMFGHIYLEMFNPGDYYETDSVSWFVRWQVDFKF